MDRLKVELYFILCIKINSGCTINLNKIQSRKQFKENMRKYFDFQLGNYFLEWTQKDETLKKTKLINFIKTRTL